MSELRIPWSRFTDCVEEMCEDYCKWNGKIEDEGVMEKFCEECPLVNLDYDEFWERREKE